MPILARDERSVLFVHIPKTRGTTLELMAQEAGWGVALRATPRKDPELFPLYRCSPQHYHASMLRQMLRLGRFDAVFTVTREPLARFRSEYAMRKRFRELGSADRVEKWTRWCLNGFAKNKYYLDNHIRPQLEFVLPRATVFKLEDGMSSIVSALNRDFDLGLSSHIPRQLSSEGPGQLRSSDVELNTATEKLLRDFYAEDFSQLGY